MFAEVSLLESSIDFLSYYVPQNLIPYLKIGSLVKVPLRGKIKPGIVVAVHDRMEVFNHKNTILKEIFQVVDEQFIPENLLNLLSWAREYYFASWGQIFQLVLSLPVYCYSVTPRNLNRQENFLSYGMSEKCKCDDEFQVILDTVNNRKHRVFLLLNNINIPLYKYYRELIINTLQLGRSVIFLVPEIRNIKEIISRLAVNENLISIWHSGLKTSDRRKIWFKIKSQKISLVIGTRSALFMPINDLGLIIIAEEHSRYYKEERAFHYHARELAIRYGEISQAAVLLESSTPSIESFYNTQIKKFKLITIAHKFINSVSNVRVINLQKHRDWIISEPLKEEILRANKQGGNVLLYHNKIGYARFVICGDCGYIHTCLRCGVPLALDLERDLFICRMCTNQTSTFDVCPSCHGYNFIYRGWGIQKIVSELKKILPNTPISVITSESSWKTLEPDKNIPQIFVVTKFGLWKLNWTNILLAAITLADNLLLVKDYRAGEWAFQELSEIIQKAINNKNIPVIIQTYRPKNSAIEYAAMLDYKGFYEQEIKTRKELFYPPFGYLTQINIVDEDLEKIKVAISIIKDKFKYNPQITVLGPVIFSKHKKKITQILLKTSVPLMNLISYDELSKHFGNNKLKFDINVDP